MRSVNKDAIAKTIAVMEAPGFKWGKGVLRDEDGCMCEPGAMCVLGAMCEAYLVDTGDGRWVADRFCVVVRRNELAFAFSAPRRVLDWAGLATGAFVSEANDDADSKEDVINYLRRIGGIE